MKNFAEDMGINGHLTILRQWNDGQQEVLLDDSNIIVSGMGVGLSYLFTGSGSDTILDYQIDRFQIGVSGPPEGGVTSGISQLSGQLTEGEYGAASNLFISINTQLVEGNEVTNRAFARIPANKITRIGDSSVRYTLVIDEEACNSLSRGGDDLNLNEIGMFMKNPTGTTSDRPILVRYRTFSNIRKTDDFSLIFRWTLNF